MRKFKLFAVEDNPEQLQILRRNLKKFGKYVDLTMCVMAESYNRADEILATGEIFDASILDVYLDEGMTCYNLFEVYDREQFGELIFNSSIPEAQKNLHDFKIPGRFYVLEDKYSDASLAKVFRDLSNNRAVKSSAKTTIVLSYPDRKITIYQHEIVFIEKVFESNNCLIHYLRNGEIETYSTKDTLKHLEEILDSTLIIKIHKQYLINYRPENIETTLPGSIELKHSKNGKPIVLPVSESYQRNLYEKLGMEL